MSSASNRAEHFLKSPLVAWVSLCIQVAIALCVYVCMYVCVAVCICVAVCVCVCVCVYFGEKICERVYSITCEKRCMYMYV